MSAPSATRTRDLLLRRQLLYPLSYRGLTVPKLTWTSVRLLTAAGGGAGIPQGFARHAPVPAP